MFRGKDDLHYSKNIIYFKWYNNKPVLLLVTNVDGRSGVSNVIRQTWNSANKTLDSYPNIIKRYNDGMGGVDTMDEETADFRLDRKIKYHFYLRMFFDLIDVTFVNIYTVYRKLGNYV